MIERESLAHFIQPRPVAGGHVEVLGILPRNSEGYLAQICLARVGGILFLRPEEPGLLINSGDLDARLKTVFDALRMPANLDETGGEGPAEKENPFFVLLEDDKLVTEVRMTTDKLLFPYKTANDALLVIHVKLKPTRPVPNDWVFA